MNSDLVFAEAVSENIEKTIITTITKQTIRVVIFILFTPFIYHRLYDTTILLKILFAISTEYSHQTCIIKQKTRIHKENGHSFEHPLKNNLEIKIFVSIWAKNKQRK